MLSFLIDFLIKCGDEIVTGQVEYVSVVVGNFVLVLNARSLTQSINKIVSSCFFSSCYLPRVS